MRRAELSQRAQTRRSRLCVAQQTLVTEPCKNLEGCLIAVCYIADSANMRNPALTVFEMLGCIRLGTRLWKRTGITLYARSACDEPIMKSNCCLDQACFSCVLKLHFRSLQVTQCPFSPAPDYLKQA